MVRGALRGSAHSDRPECLFAGPEVAQQGERVSGELGLEDGVEKRIGALRTINGAGEVDARSNDGRSQEGAGKQNGASLPQRLEAVTQIRTEGDACPHKLRNQRRPRTSCIS